MSPPASILIYGYGNPGRQDDGLGVLLVEKIEQWARGVGRTDLVFDSNYQLNVEDALTISNHDIVIFADATQTGSDRFAFRPLQPQATISFSTHAMTPESVLALCDELYYKRPSAHLLTIRGYAWEPNAAVTAAAAANLVAAQEFITAWLQKQR
ncbi:MAG: hydrogenase maturation protease [Verrucomicrobia bacterium]|nr:MAG: hydrogenase maturation protease [Verrucomicrobiota bacterium]